MLEVFGNGFDVEDLSWISYHVLVVTGISNSLRKYGVPIIKYNQLTDTFRIIWWRWRESNPKPKFNNLIFQYVKCMIKYSDPSVIRF